MGFLDNLGNLKGNLGTQRESPEIRMTLENIARADGEIQEKIFQLGQKYYEENKNKETGELSQPYASIIDAVKKLEENWKGFFKNKVTHILLVVIAANLFSTLGTIIGGLDIVKSFLSTFF